MSISNVSHFRRTGTLPDIVSDPTFDAQTKDAFSSNPRPEFDDEEDDDFRSGRVGGGGGGGSGIDERSNSNDEDYALLHQSELDDLGPLRTPYDPTTSLSTMGESMYGGGSTYGGGGTAYGGSQQGRYEPPSPSVYSRTPFR